MPAPSGASTGSSRGSLICCATLGCCCWSSVVNGVAACSVTFGLGIRASIGRHPTGLGIVVTELVGGLVGLLAIVHRRRQAAAIDALVEVLHIGAEAALVGFALAAGAGDRLLVEGPGRDLALAFNGERVRR